MSRDFVRNGSVLVTFDAQHCPQDLHFPDIDHASFFQVHCSWSTNRVSGVNATRGTSDGRCH